MLEKEGTSLISCDPAVFHRMLSPFNLSPPQYLSPARPNGIALHNIIKTRQLHPTGDDTNIFNLTIAMEIIPASCDYDIPLMNITLVNESTSGTLVWVDSSPDSHILASSSYCMLVAPPLPTSLPPSSLPPSRSLLPLSSLLPPSSFPPHSLPPPKLYHLQ